MELTLKKIPAEKKQDGFSNKKEDETPGNIYNMKINIKTTENIMFKNSENNICLIC